MGSDLYKSKTVGSSIIGATNNKIIDPIIANTQLIIVKIDAADKDAVTAENTATITYDIVDGEGNSLKTEAVLEAPANAASEMVEDSFEVELGTIPSIVATYTDYLTITVSIA